jgi:hypothetical protein
MKNIVSASSWRIGMLAASLTLVVQTRAGVIFSDNFNTGASPLWGNDSGAWVASGGVYAATAPNNFPAAVSSLPFNLTDFTVDLDINGVTDGGIYLRSTPEPGTAVGIQGVLLNLKNPNLPGFGNIYFHIVTNGTAYSPPLNQVTAPYAAGANVHLHIEVSGDTYSAFLNGSSIPVDTLTTSVFPNGGIALYDFSSQTFDNVVIQAVPEPPTPLLLSLGCLGSICWRSWRKVTSDWWFKSKTQT